MEKPQKLAAQIYGYTICLVAVITLLITITTLVNALFDLQDPLHSINFRMMGSPSLASFENYKMDVLKSTPRRDREGAAENTSYVPDDKTLIAMFEAAKVDKIQSVKHSGHQQITISVLLIVICSILFMTHWSWMKRIRTETVSSVV
jgi:hypothetical protein